MPTPFSHLAVAQRLLNDELLPQNYRDFLRSELGAFLPGNVAADARVGAGVPREQTHFYLFAQDIVESPWRVMLKKHPELWQPHSAAQQAFIAGYIAHLAMDEIWSRQMVRPHFAEREWGERALRFLMLHIILIYMDERDLRLIEPWQADKLDSVQPDHWLPFISDQDLSAWQRLIADQIKPGGVSQTLNIFGGRIAKTPAELRAILDSDQQMQADLWDHIPPEVLKQVEENMYLHARDGVSEYLSKSGSW